MTLAGEFRTVVCSPQFSLQRRALPAARVSIRYQIKLACPLCGCDPGIVSPQWSVLHRLPSVEKARQADAQLVYEFTIWHKRSKWDPPLAPGSEKPPEIHIYTIRGDVGKELKSFLSCRWNCRQCGITFGLTGDETSAVLDAMSQEVTLEHAREFILANEPLHVGDTHMVDCNRFWKLLLI